jgi:outer membrane immunogenic protein
VDGAATNKAGQRRSLPPFLADQVHDTKESWPATARLRLGYGWDKWLFYVTGGGAWAGVEESLFFTPAPAISIHQKQTRSGWTAGAGWEYALGYGWSIKSEFLYMDFGTKNSWAPAERFHVAIDVAAIRLQGRLQLQVRLGQGARRRHGQVLIARKEPPSSFRERS